LIISTYNSRIQKQGVSTPETHSIMLSTDVNPGTGRTSVPSSSVIVVNLFFCLDNPDPARPFAFFSDLDFGFWEPEGPALGTSATSFFPISVKSKEVNRK
jgi:hypothetical protein